MRKKDDDYHLIFGEDGPDISSAEEDFLKAAREAGMSDAVSSILSALISRNGDEAERLLEEGVENGSINDSDGLYYFSRGVIAEARGMEALEAEDLQSGAEYLREARDCFRRTLDAGFSSDVVRDAIHDISVFLDDEDMDDEDEDDGFDPLSVDYMGFRREFPSGGEFVAVLRLDKEDFSVDPVKDEYLDLWDEKPRSKKLKEGSWKLTAGGVTVKLVHQKCIEIPSRYDERVIGGDDDNIEYLFNPSVARLTVTAEVGDESSYERSVVFTKVLGALISSYDGVSIDIQGVLRDPADVFDIIIRHDDDAWLCSAVTTGFIIEGAAATGNLAIKSSGLTAFGFPEIVMHHIAPDDMTEAAVIVLDLQRYMFTFGLGEPPEGHFMNADGARFSVRKKKKKDGSRVIEVAMERKK